MREQHNLMFRMPDDQSNYSGSALWADPETSASSSSAGLPLSQRMPAPEDLVSEQIKPSFIQKSGRTALLRAASPLIAILIQLKREPKECDMTRLRQQMIHEVKQFELQAKADGLSGVTVLAARYVLCTVIDEGVLTTPLGNSGDWGVKSLLSTFHQDTWGGEKFFQVLDRMCEDPAVNIELIELMYLCLSLGFKGKYRVLKNGQEQLQTIRAHLYRIIQRERGSCERELSRNWVSRVQQRGTTRALPIWRILTVTAVLALAIYAGFSTVLYQHATPLSQQLQTLVQPYTEATPSTGTTPTA